MLISTAPLAQPELGDSGQEVRRLEQERDAAVGCGAWAWKT